MTAGGIGMSAFCAACATSWRPSTAASCDPRRWTHTQSQQTQTTHHHNHHTRTGRTCRRTGRSSVVRTSNGNVPKPMLPLLPIIQLVIHHRPSRRIISHLTSDISHLHLFVHFRHLSPPLRYILYTILYTIYTLYTEARLSHFSQPFSPAFQPTHHHPCHSIHNPKLSHVILILLFISQRQQKDHKYLVLQRISNLCRNLKTRMSSVQEVGTQDLEVKALTFRAIR